MRGGVRAYCGTRMKVGWEVELNFRTRVGFGRAVESNLIERAVEVLYQTIGKLMTTELCFVSLRRATVFWTGDDAFPEMNIRVEFDGMAATGKLKLIWPPQMKEIDDDELARCLYVEILNQMMIECDAWKEAARKELERAMSVPAAE